MLRSCCRNYVSVVLQRFAYWVISVKPKVLSIIWTLSFVESVNFYWWWFWGCHNEPPSNLRLFFNSITAFFPLCTPTDHLFLHIQVFCLGGKRISFGKCWSNWLHWKRGGLAIQPNHLLLISSLDQGLIVLLVMICIMMRCHPLRATLSIPWGYSQRLPAGN